MHSHSFVASESFIEDIEDLLKNIMFSVCFTFVPENGKIGKINKTTWRADELFLDIFYSFISFPSNVM